MATNNELQQICDRQIQAAQEFKAHAVTLAQFDEAVKAKHGELAGLQNQIAQAKTLAAEVAEVDQLLRSKRSELAELELNIRRKHEQHGSIDADLRALIKRASSVTA